MRRAALAIALLTAAPAAARPGPDAIARIRTEGTDHSQALALHRTLTDRFGPRLTASPAHRASAEWARDRLRGRGPSDARLEAFSVGPGWTLESLRLEMLRPWYFPLVGHPEAWSPGTAAPRRTLRFTLWGGEEQGLPGSRGRADTQRHNESGGKTVLYLTDDPGAAATCGFCIAAEAAAQASAANADRLRAN